VADLLVCHILTRFDQAFTSQDVVILGFQGLANF